MIPLLGHALHARAQVVASASVDTDDAREGAASAPARGSASEAARLLWPRNAWLNRDPYHEKGSGFLSSQVQLEREREREVYVYVCMYVYIYMFDLQQMCVLVGCYPTAARSEAILTHYCRTAQLRRASGTHWLVRSSVDNISSRSSTTLSSGSSSRSRYESTENCKEKRLHAQI